VPPLDRGNAVVKAEARLAPDGVVKNVAMPVPNPETPVEIGNPVALVNVAEVGVPRIGVTRVGDVALTTFPLPVDPTKVNAPTFEVSVFSKKPVPAAEGKAIEYAVVTEVGA
jgi:hypothetical protein